ncbi:MAG: MMPL family transporter [Betaproteobacteria bacterium]
MTRSGRSVVALWLVCLTASGYWLARHASITTEVSAFLPAAANRAQALLVGQLREGVASRLLLIAIEHGDPNVLPEASRMLAQQLEATGLFGTVANGDPARTAKESAFLFSHRYVLSPGVAAQRFGVEGLRDALQEEMELLASPFGILTRRTLPADPTGEMRRIAAAMPAPGAAPARTGVWLSPDGQRALLVAETRAAGYDIDAQTRAAAAVRQAFSENAPPGAVLRLAGPGIAASSTRETIERDAVRASLLSLTGVFLLLAAVYRSPRPVVLSALPALTGLALGTTAVSLLFGPVHGITLAFGAMLIGEAVDYPTYLYAHAGRGESLQHTLERIGATLGLAILTTACGALAMLLSSFRGLAQLGVLIVVGVLVAGAVTRWVLPALTPARTLERKMVRVPFADAPRSRFARGTLWWIAALAACGFAILLMQNERLWDDDLANLGPVPAELRALDAELRGQLGAPDVRHLVVVMAPDREQALQKSEVATQRLERAIASGWIARYDLAARYLPSRRTQAARRAALPDTATLGSNLERAMHGLSFRAGLFAPFLADVERARSGPWLDDAALQGTAFALRVETLLRRAGDQWAALVPLSGVRDPRALADAVAANGDPDVFLIDLKREADALVAGYRGEALRLFALGLLCVALLVYAGVRSAATTARVLVPVLAAAVLDVATLVLLGQRLTVFHMVALLLVIGVGLNYALFFNRRQWNPEERALTLLSLTVAGLATLWASSILATSGTPVLRAIGTTIAAGTLYAFVLSALLARPESPRGADERRVS